MDTGQRPIIEASKAQGIIMTIRLYAGVLISGLLSERCAAIDRFTMPKPNTVLRKKETGQRMWSMEHCSKGFSLKKHNVAY